MELKARRGSQKLTMEGQKVRLERGVEEASLTLMDFLLLSDMLVYFTITLLIPFPRF